MGTRNLGTETDFRTFTVEETAKFLVANVADFGDPQTIEALAADEVVEEVRAGHAVVVAERNAVAVVRPEVDHIQKCNPVLWLLYVDPASRGQRLGATFVAEIRRRFEKKLPMALACNGPRREAFFTACGFHVHERLEDNRVIMTAGVAAEA